MIRLPALHAAGVVMGQKGLPHSLNVLDIRSGIPAVSHKEKVQYR